MTVGNAGVTESFKADDIIPPPPFIDRLALTQLLVKFILRLWEVTQRQGNSK